MQFIERKEKDDTGQPISDNRRIFIPAGIPTSKVSKLIREGKIKSGKWMIHPDQLQAKAVQEPGKSSKPKPKKIAAKAPREKAAARTTTSVQPKKK